VRAWSLFFLVELVQQEERARTFVHRKTSNGNAKIEKKGKGREGKGIGLLFTW
jgi:hypothetical protein